MPIIDSGRSQFYAFIVHKFAIGVFGANGLTLTAGFFESAGYVVTERARYPEKIRRDCALCPRRFGCDEVCDSRMLRADTLEYAV